MEQLPLPLKFKEPCNRMSYPEEYQTFFVGAEFNPLSAIQAQDLTRVYRTRYHDITYGFNTGIPQQPRQYSFWNRLFGRY